MDKNLVNIDNLFRQRLSGGEEKERAGAWANMSELLDKEMPAKRAMGVPWRRMLTYTAGLVLLASMSFGGYEVISAHRDVADARIAAGEGNSTGRNRVSNTPDARSATTQSTEAIKGTHSTASNHEVATQVAVNTNSIHTTTPNSDLTTRTTANITNTHRLTTITTQTKKLRGIHNIIKNIAAPRSSRSAGNTSASVWASNTSKNHNGIKKNSIAVNAISAGLPNRPNTLNKTTSNHIAASQSAASGSGTITSSQTTKSKRAVRKNDLTALAAGTTHATNDKAAVDVAEKVKLDKVEVVQHYVSKAGGKQGHYINDTIDKSEVYDTRYVQTPGSSATAPTASKETVAQSSATQASASSGAGTFKNALYASTAKNSALSNSKTIATNHNKKRSVTLSNFADMIRDFRTNLGNATFAPGITGGINATFFAPNNINGFQLGVSGTVTFNDTWSFMAELKYFTRFSGNAVINDNYVNYTPLGNGYYRRDSAEHFFKYNNLQSVELPFTLRYTTGKYSIFGGGNLAYDFAINNDFVDYHYASQITNELSKTIKPQYSENDFVSRFGVGYVVGGSYNITPLLHADARIVQTLWDNSSTSGSQSISKDFYKHPSFQLSIGYTLKKKENKMP